MTTFEIDITTNNNISIEFQCIKCNDISSTVLDAFVQEDILPYSNEDVLYCINCERPYKYTVKIEQNKLEVIFKNKIIGSLKYSDKVRLEEYEEDSPIKSKRFYYIQIERLKKLLEIKIEEYSIDQSLTRLVFSGVITSLETYLNEVFVQIVFYSDITLKTFVTEFEPYRKERIFLHEIFIKYDSLESRVRDDLESIIYHNISKLISIFNIFNFELEKFDRIKNVAQHIQLRHNFVHRSGLNKDDCFEEVSKEDINLLIDDINLLIEYIHKKYEDKCFLSDFDRIMEDLPF